MRSLSLISLFLLFILFIGFMPNDSPHGKDFKISCSVCHSANGWKLDKENYSFDHNTTNLPLEGQHLKADCRLCHPTLIFNEAGTDCMDCHTDIHEQTLGSDCSRCHTPNSWLVTNIREMHELSRFPLVGVHAMADCYDCHHAVSLLKFEPLGIDCIDCHQEEYTASTNPNHLVAGFSTECSDCHNIFAYEWGASGFNHSYFPLTLGHNIQECSKCHTSADYSDITANCFDCHEADYNSSTNPNHLSSNFPTDCGSCHTTNPAWKPATFDHDGPFFPIYSGEHQGEWNNCVDCHTNTSNYAVYTCIDCHDHNKSEMDDKHKEEKDYTYNSIACFDCHPRGKKE